MNQLHHHLKQKSSWYRFWHSEQHHQKVHWLVFILFAVFLTSLIALKVTNSELSSVSSSAASDTITLFPGQTKVTNGVEVRYVAAKSSKLFFWSEKPSLSLTWNNQNAVVGLRPGESAKLFDGSVLVLFISQSRDGSATLKVDTKDSIVAQTYIDKGWDPGMLKRRIATIYPNGRGYYENCPDTPNGICYPDILAGGGFYTLSPSMMEDVNAPCKVNSRELFTVPGTGQQEPCPYFFEWSTDSNGRVAAVLTDDSRNWSRSDTPNLYLGLQHNTPFSGLYMGANNMPNINEAYYEAYMQASTEGVRTDQNAYGRFMTGLAWYVPSLAKSFVVEFNLDSFNTNDPRLSTTVEAADNPSCGAAVKCTYLGARFWGYQTVIGTTPRLVKIDWADIVSKLVQRGYLPAEAYGNYPVSVFHSGPEMFGRGKLVDRISGATIKAKVRQ